MLTDVERRKKWHQAHPNDMAVWIGSSIVMSQCKKQFNLRGASTCWSYQNRLFWETRSAAARHLEWFMTCLNRVDRHVIHNTTVERSATENNGVRSKINRWDNAIWNQREGAIHLWPQKMEVLERSILHFAFWLSPMPLEMASVDVTWGWLLPM